MCNIPVGRQMVGRFCDGLLDVIYQRKVRRTFYSPNTREAQGNLNPSIKCRQFCGSESIKHTAYQQRTETTYRSGNSEVDSAAEIEYKIQKLEEICVPQVQRDFLKLDGIELESYFRRIPRKECEALLANKDAGTCIVRPYKEFDPFIKYVLSIVCGQNYFHLHIRRKDNGRFAVGKHKTFEESFDSALEIVRYYSENPLMCSNEYQTAELFLSPLK